MLGVPLSVLLTWGTWAALGLAVLLLACVAWGRPTPGPRCSRCGYDMAGVGLRCPECGRAHRAERELLRRRRAWRLLPLAALCAAGMPVWSVWREEIRRAWWWVAYPRWKLVETTTAGPVEFRLFWGGRPDSLWTDRAFEVRNEGVVVIRDEGRGSEWMTAALLTTESGEGLRADVTGDGEPESFVSTFTGGAHCCETLLILDPTRAGGPAAEVHLRHGGCEITDLDGDGVHEIVVVDWSFEYWPRSFAGSPTVRVALRWDGVGLRVDPALTRGLQGAAVAGVHGRAEIERLVHGPPLHADGTRELWRIALQLLYGGLEDEAWLLLASARGRVPQVTDERIAEFRELLEASPYWQGMHGSVQAGTAGGFGRGP